MASRGDSQINFVLGADSSGAERGFDRVSQKLDKADRDMVRLQQTQDKLLGASNKVRDLEQAGKDPSRALAQFNALLKEEGRLRDKIEAQQDKEYLGLQRVNRAQDQINAKRKAFLAEHNAALEVQRKRVDAEQAAAMKTLEIRRNADQVLRSVQGPSRAYGLEYRDQWINRFKMLDIDPPGVKGVTTITQKLRGLFGLGGSDQIHARLKHVETGVLGISSAAGRGSTSLADMLTSLNMLGGIGGLLSFGAVIGVLQSISDHLDAIGEKANKAQKDMTSLITQNPILGNENTQAAALMGAKYGVEPGDAAAILQEQLSATGQDQKQALINSNEALQLMRLGVSQEAAANVIRYGKAGGLSAQQSSALSLMGAQKANFSPSQMANAMKGSASIKDPYLATAIAAALTQEKVTAEQLPTRLEAAGIGMNVDKSPFAKSIAEELKAKGGDWSQMGELDRLRYLKATLPDTSMSALMTKGLEKEAAVGLSQTLKQLPYIEQILPELKATPETMTDDRISEMTKKNPQLAAAWKSEEARLMGQYDRTFGYGALRAQRMQEIRYTQGRALEDTGLGFLTDESGKPGWTGKIAARVLEPVMAGAAERPGQWENVQRMRDEIDQNLGSGNSRVITDLVESITKLTTSVDQNNQITAQNTQATAGQRVMPPRSSGGRGATAGVRKITEAP